MIITECPNCNRPKIVGWEIDMSVGWMPVRCTCDVVFWVEATSFNGKTYSHDSFLEEILKNNPTHVERANQIAANTVADEEDAIA